MSSPQSAVSNQQSAGSLPTFSIDPPTRWTSIGFRELWDYRELLYFLTLRDIKVRAGAIPTCEDAILTCAGAISACADAIPACADAIPACADAIPACADAIPACADAIPACADAIPTGAAATKVTER